MDHMDMLSLAAPIAEVVGLLALFVKLHTAPKFAQLESEMTAARSDIAEFRAQIDKAIDRFEESEQRHGENLLKFRAEVGEIVTKAHDRINPIERDIARLLERTGAKS